LRGGLVLARGIEVALVILLLVQIIMTVLIWTLNPILVSHQTLAAGYIASSLIILSLVTYVYYRGEEYDQEWIAAGIGMIVLIMSLVYLKGGVV